MAYIPPHKRHLKGGAASSPPTPALPPESVIPRFQRNLTPMSKDHRQNILWAENAIWTWFVVGLADESRVSDLIRMESFERRPGEKLLAAVLEESDEAIEFSANPWVFVAETVKEDLFSSFQQVKDEMSAHEFGEVTPILSAHFGRALFDKNRSFTADSTIGSSQHIDELMRFFYTNIPPSFMEYVTSKAIPEIGFEFEKEKEQYLVKLSDKKAPDSTILCKCTVAKDTNQLELYKIELNQVRHLVADMSCLDRNLDLRLMLYTRRIWAAVTDEELEKIKSLISYARLDSEVKGGLRWPLGKESSGDQFTVVGVWHTNAKIFRNSSVRLKISYADRFNFRSSYGEFARNVSLKMPGIESLLRSQEQTVNTEVTLEMLKENLKMIWTHFFEARL